MPDQIPACLHTAATASMMLKIDTSDFKAIGTYVFMIVFKDVPRSNSVWKPNLHYFFESPELIPY
jgi:hypothetical protein